MNKILDLEYFARQGKQSRLQIMKTYPKAGIRLNKESNNIEIKLINFYGKQVWIPLDYCLNEQLSIADWKEFHDELNK